MSRIIVIRHGRTTWNDQGRFQGSVDVDLDEIGRRQIADAAAVLSRFEIDVVVSSDLARARETAEAVAGPLGLSVRTDKRLRERAYGPWEGLNREQIEERFPSEFAQWLAGEPHALPGIEPRDDVARRGAEVLSEVAAEIADGGTALVSSHGGTARQAMARFLGWSRPQADTLSGLNNCHWADLRGGARGWRLHAYNLSAGTVS